MREAATVRAAVEILHALGASLAVARYDDNLAGPGVSVTAALGISLETPLTLRAHTSRFLGDEGYRAWRTKIGPQWSLLAVPSFPSVPHIRSPGVPARARPNAAVTRRARR